MTEQEQKFAKNLGKQFAKKKVYCPCCGKIYPGKWPGFLKVVKENENWLVCPHCEMVVKLMVIKGVGESYSHYIDME